MRVDPDSPLAEDLKKLKEKEGKDHILMSFMFKVRSRNHYILMLHFTRLQYISDVKNKY